MIIGKIYKRDGLGFSEYQSLEHVTDSFKVVDADATRIIAGNATNNMARTWVLHMLQGMNQAVQAPIGSQQVWQRRRHEKRRLSQRLGQSPWRT